MSRISKSQFMSVLNTKEYSDLFAGLRLQHSDLPDDEFSDYMYKDFCNSTASCFQFPGGLEKLLSALMSAKNEKVKVPKYSVDPLYQEWMAATEDSSKLPTGFRGQLWNMLNTKSVADRRIIKELTNARSLLVTWTIPHWYGPVYDCIYFNRIEVVDFIAKENLIPGGLQAIPDLVAMIEVAARRKHIGLDMLELIAPFVTFTKELLDVFISHDLLPEAQLIANLSKLVPNASHANKAYETGKCNKCNIEH